MAVLPDFGAAEFEPGAPIDNPYFPLKPGTILSYGGSKIDEDTGEVETERNDVFVTAETKQIEGVKSTVVRDTAYANGVLVEDTLDWYAQDTAGNVWYMGELSYNFEYDDDGNFIGTDTDGSWEAGVDGALPGYIMPADPQVGDSYFNEFYPGVAVDEAEVVARGEQISIGLGTFDDVLQTFDTTALEPDAREFKYYAPGIGNVLTEEGLDEANEPDFVAELRGVRSVEQDDDDDEGRRGKRGDKDDEDDEGRRGQRGDEDDRDDEGRKHKAKGLDKNDRDKGDHDDDEEIGLSDLADGRSIDPRDAEEPDAEDFLGDGSDMYVTFLAENADFNNAIGVYEFDKKTGAMGEGRILFDGTDDVGAGETVAVEVGKGAGLGVFLVSDGGDSGIDLSAFEDRGLKFSNFSTGRTATLDDGLAPLVTSAGGEVLPIQALHALGADDGFNFLNPAVGMQAIALDSEKFEEASDGDVELIGFEDLQVTDPAYDGDFNDVIVAVSEAPLDADIWA